MNVEAIGWRWIIARANDPNRKHGRSGLIGIAFEMIPPL